MTEAGPLQWQSGGGWLVLSGGGRWEAGEAGDIDAAALGWAMVGRPVAVLLTAGASTASGEALVDYLVDLGAPEGYIVPVFDEAGARNLENCGLLAQAGLIYIADGPDIVRLVRVLRGSPALEAIGQAFEIGASIYAVGAAAMALGAWVSGGDQAEHGLGLLENLVIEPRFSGAESASRLRHLLAAHPDCMGLGVPYQSAVALGPEGQVRTMGSDQITVVVAQSDEG
ncbi:MAG: hypothetical protein GX620_17975 [Chloroflexi bacterium]|nr:hypothetical protein [Chloroflexota bacterium]